MFKQNPKYADFFRSLTTLEKGHLIVLFIWIFCGGVFLGSSLEGGVRVLACTLSLVIPFFAAGLLGLLAILRD